MKARIWNDREWIEETSPSVLKEYFRETLKSAGFNILDVLEHYFEPQGYTAIFLLSESHFAIHTFPEFGKTYIELSSCNKDYFCNYLNLLKKA